ncbi:MAG TPA: glycoside hydrolase family 3 N-terminal domain-containing protein [Gemmatimonadaceae bacterium]|nr:glycoside hydrolase family 3 N-terminal domain-containing protein [Gemmatimonadaceae bacterium]
MVARAARSLLLVGAAAALSACATTTRNAPAAAAREGAWADSVLATLSLRDKAAQMVWPWVLGDYTAADDPTYRRVERLVREQRVGGIIISVGSPTEIASKLNALQQVSALPLLVGADLETGAAFRARGGYFLPNAIDLGGATYFPYAMGIGATRDTAFAYQMGRATAREGRALGIHMAFAPVLDVNNNPKNPVISLRSFGENPQLVAGLGAAFVRGIQENGMLATGKHFPGHGDTEQNSHLELSRVNASKARLDSVELLPFRAAVQAGVRGIMTFHGQLPGLDTSSLPATLNPRIMTDLLRGQLGFRGLVVTDALDMNGVLGKMTMAEVTQRAVAAGNDVLLMPTDIAGAIDAVVDGVRRGLFPESRIDESVRKLLVAKQEMGLSRQRLTDLQAMRSVVGDSSTVANARAAAERAITLVKDSLGLVPFSGLPRTARVVSVTIAPRTDLGAGVAFNAELARAFPALRSISLSTEQVFDATAAAAAAPGQNAQYIATPQPRLLPALVENALRGAQGADLVIVSSYFGASSSTSRLAAPDGMADLLLGLQKAGTRVVLATFSNPYLAQDLPPVSSYLVTYGGSPLMQRAAARALLGLAPIGGQLPITIPSVAPYGSGLRRAASAATGAPITP